MENEETMEQSLSVSLHLCVKVKEKLKQSVASWSDIDYKRTVTSDLQTDFIVILWNISQANTE